MSISANCVVFRTQCRETARNRRMLLKYYLLNLNEEESACESISRILRYGSKAEAPAEGTEASSPTPSAEPTPTPQETPAEA